MGLRTASDCGAFIFPLTPLGRSEARHERHHHHATILRKASENGIRHVAGVRRDRAGIAMRKKHGRGGLIQHVMHRRFGHMADIGSHPQPVHLGEHFKSKGRQPIMLGRVCCAVGPVGGQAMCDRHVARTKCISLPQDF